MAKQDCVALALELGRNAVSRDEAAAMVKTLEQRVAEERAKAGADIAGLENEMAKLATDMADKAARDALVQKRRILLNALAEKNFGATVQRFTDAGLTRQEAMQAYLVGSNKVVKGALLSVEAQQRQSWSRLLGKLSGDLNKLGDSWKMFTNPDAGIQRKIAQELFERDRKNGTPGVSGDDNARKIAEVVGTVQELARRQLNLAGADIGKLPGYIVMQEHNANAMLAAGVKAWREATLPHVDVLRTFGTTDPERVERGMDAIFRHITLGKESETLKTLADGELAYTGPANLANQLDEHRVLHFKDGGAWFDYNSQFGNRHLHESVVSGLERAGKHIALLKNMTDNPEAFIRKMGDRMMEDVRNDPRLSDAEKGRQLDTMNTNRILNLYKQLSGDINRGGSPTVANIGAGIRAFEYLRLMGKVFFSQFSDTAAMASELRYQGMNVLQRWQYLLSERVHTVDKAHHGAFYDYLGTAVDSMQGAHAATFHANDGFPGMTSRIIATMNKLNCSDWWDRGWNRAMGAATSRWLADNSQHAFERLPEAVSRLLGQYDIGAPEWHVMRNALSKMEDGRHYLTSDALRELPNADIAAYLGNAKATPREIARARDELMTKLETLVTSRATYGIMRPGARTRRWITGNLPRGDALGEVWRTMMQFKSFSLATYEKAVERELYGYGANSVKASLLNGNGSLRGLAHFMLVSSIFGYLSMTAKDVTRGIMPRDPSKASTWGAALMQSGGLGIYGDFLFGQTTRYGNSIWSSLLGPAVGSAEDVMKLWQSIRNGGEGSNMKAGYLFRFALNNLPFANLYYTRMALDYLFLYDAQEALSPGSVGRMEGAQKTNTGSEFFISPSHDRLRPFTN